MQASRTAERVAVSRAVHQLLDRPPVFDDPLARALLPPDIAAQVGDDPRAFERSPLSRFFRALFAVRSRLAEDTVHEAVASGVRQYVVLGAGFDTFAYRQSYPAAELHVFEVDQPATQAVKRARLAESRIAVPPTMTFVPCDFERASLAACLDAAGFDRTAPAVFAWLGVVPYLALEAIRATLGFIASLPRDTQVVFDYGLPTAALSPQARRIRELLGERVAEGGEPWRTYFDPADLAGVLRAAGFARIEDFDAGALQARYFAGRRDGLTLAGSGHIARATV